MHVGHTFAFDVNDAVIWPEWSGIRKHGSASFRSELGLYTVSGLPANSGISIDPATGVVFGKPAEADAEIDQPMHLRVTRHIYTSEVPSPYFELQLNVIHANRTPIGSSTRRISIYPDKNFKLDISSMFHDPDGDQLTFSVDSLGLYSDLSINAVTGILSGKVARSELAKNPSVLLRITANDGQGGESSQTIILVPTGHSASINYSPSLSDKAPGEVKGFLGMPLSVDMKQWYTDTDSHELYFTFERARFGCPSGLQVDSGLRLGIDGLLSGIPTYADFRNSPFRLCLVASDRSGVHSRVVFDVQIDLKAQKNTPPISARAIGVEGVMTNRLQPAVAAAFVGEYFSYDLSSLFTDMDNDSLTFQIRGLPSDSGLSLDRQTGILAGYIPKQRFVVSLQSLPDKGHIWTILIDGNDGRGGTSSQDLHIVVFAPMSRQFSDGKLRNTSPVADVLPAVMAYAGQEFSLDVSSKFSDPEGDKLYFGIAGLPDGSGLHCDPVSGVISGVITDSHVGDNKPPIVVFANDGYGGQGHTLLYIIAVAGPGSGISPSLPPPDGHFAKNNPPVLLTSPVEAYLVRTGQYFYVDLSKHFTDVDGDELEYRLKLGVPGFRMRLDSKQGFLIGLSRERDAKLAQPINLWIEADDGHGGSTTQTISLAIIPEETLHQAKVSSSNSSPESSHTAFSTGAPVALSVLFGLAFEGQVFSTDVSQTFVDPDGDALRFSVEGLPEGSQLAMQAETGIFSGMVTQIDAQATQPLTIKIIANDGKSSAQTTLSLPVLPLGSPENPGNGNTQGNTNPSGMKKVLSERSCQDLSWTLRYGDPSVCGASLVSNGKCSREVTFDEADKMCKHLGARLCTSEELANDEAKLTGCKLETKRIWSSTVCDEEKVYTQAGASEGLEIHNKQCTMSTSPVLRYRVRCCADVHPDEVMALVRPVTAAPISVPSVAHGSSALDSANQGKVGHGGSAYSTNVAPVSSAIRSQTVSEGKTVTIDISKNFWDPEEEKLTFSQIGLPANGGLRMDAITGVLSGTPNRHDAKLEQPLSIIIVATDPHGVQSQEILSLHVVAGNFQPPSLVSRLKDVHTSESEDLWFDVGSHFRDPNGGQLNYLISGLPPGSGLAADTTIGLISGTPNSVDTSFSPLQILVVARNNYDQQLEQSFVITVSKRNRAPIASEKGLEIASLDMPLPARVGIDFIYSIDSVFIDPDGDAISYVLESGLPMGSGLRLVDGWLAGVPSAEDAASPQPLAVRVTARDSAGAAQTETFYVYIGAGNSAPQIRAHIPEQLAFEGEFYSLELSYFFSDPDGDSLAYMMTTEHITVEPDLRADGLPFGSGFSLDHLFAVFSGIPNTVDVAASQPLRLRVTATDPSGASVSQVLALRVSHADRRPIVKNNEDVVFSAGIKGHMFFLDVSDLFYDADGDSLTYEISEMTDYGLPAGTGLALNCKTGHISGVPTNEDALAFQPLVLPVVASDPTGGQASLIVAITIQIGSKSTCNEKRWSLISVSRPTVCAHSLGPSMTFANPGSACPKTDDFEKVSRSCLDAGVRLCSAEEFIAGVYSFQDQKCDKHGPIWTATLCEGGRVMQVVPEHSAHGTGFTTVCEPRSSVADMICCADTTVHNSPPKASQMPKMEARIGKWSFLPLSTYFEDPEKEPLIFELDTRSLPSEIGMQLDPSLGILYGTPDLQYAKDGDRFYVKISAIDTAGQAVSNTLELEFVKHNEPPTFVETVDGNRVHATKGQPFLLEVSRLFLDADGDDLTYSVIGLPSSTGLVFESSSGTLYGTPDQRDMDASPIFLHLIANDGQSRVEGNVTLHVVSEQGPVRSTHTLAPATAVMGKGFFLDVAPEFALDPSLGVTFAQSGLPEGSGIILHASGKLYGSVKQVDLQALQPIVVEIVATSTQGEVEKRTLEVTVKSSFTQKPVAYEQKPVAHEQKPVVREQGTASLHALANNPASVDPAMHPQLHHTAPDNQDNAIPDFSATPTIEAGTLASFSTAAPPPPAPGAPAPSTAVDAYVESPPTAILHQVVVLGISFVTMLSPYLTVDDDSQPTYSVSGLPQDSGIMLNPDNGILLGIPNGNDLAATQPLKLTVTIETYDSYVPASQIRLKLAVLAGQFDYSSICFFS